MKINLRRKLEKKTKQKIKVLLFIVGLFTMQLIILALINYQWIRYYDDDEVEELKDKMMYFSYTHQNPDSNLFLEIEIDTCYRSIDSINPIDLPYIGIAPIKLINPLKNDELKSSKSDFFFNYLIEKQNDNGSYSDIGGLGNMYDTFKVVETIDKLNPNFINEDPSMSTGIIEYLSKSLVKYGWGFKNSELNPIPDMTSTYYAIKLANRFNARYIYENENISNFININLIGETPELTYHAINAYLESGMIFNSLQNNTINLYFSSRYNFVDGGYSLISGGISDIQSTFFSLASLYTMNITPINEEKSFNYVLKCVKLDGGFGLFPYLNISSDFKSGWSAMKALALLQENNNSLNNINIFSYRLNYYNWLYAHQAMNGLFGEITLNANFLGSLSVFLADEDNFTEYVDIDSVWDYVEDCYNKHEGGFSMQPGGNTSLLATYQAIQLYKIFFSYSEIELPNLEDTIEYLINLQTSDGGFELGIDVKEYLSFLGPLTQIYNNLLENDEPTTESTFWAVASLKVLDALEKINEGNLIDWISACQNADGGFSMVLGFYSDTISTYFGLETFTLLELQPMSKVAAIEFLKKAQEDDGSFVPIPAISAFYELPTSFLITFFGSMGMYDFNYQPENIEKLIKWYDKCFSSKTGGVGDYPYFGGDLRNAPFAISLIEELKYNQDFYPRPWNDLIFAIFMAELLFILLFCLIKFISMLNITISKKLKERFELGKKLNILYLQRFPAIRCENVNVYAGRKLIVDSVSIQLNHGEILGVLGESGAGKSTYVKALLGMKKFTGVSEIYGMNVKHKAKKMRPVYGYVPQDLSKVYQNFTVLQNIIYFAKQYDLNEKQIVYRTKRILSALEIEDKTNEKVKNLSGGQMRRVSIAMALIHNPIIVWMDEPTSGLDPVVRENLWLTLTKINEQFSTTLIVITHYPEESRFCHKVAIFGRNRGMIDFGRPQDLLSKLPGKGRTINLIFSNVQDNAIERLESIKDIEFILENKLGTDFSLFTDSTLNNIHKRIEIEFGKDNILRIDQSDSKMEEYFRIKALEVPVIE